MFMYAYKCMFIYINIYLNMYIYANYISPSSSQAKASMGLKEAQKGLNSVVQSISLLNR
jgi:hypothetical protein